MADAGMLVDVAVEWDVVLEVVVLEELGVVVVEERIVVVEELDVADERDVVVEELDVAAVAIGTSNEGRRGASG